MSVRSLLIPQTEVESQESGEETKYTGEDAMLRLGGRCRKLIL